MPPGRLSVMKAALKSVLSRLFARKSLAALQAQAAASQLKRSLTAFDLLMVGVGGIIGTGIFVLTGQAAYAYAGPAIVVSFIVSGVAAATAAFSYAELSSMIPISGSAYTYAYATMGELVAWIIGWTLILEYLVGGAAVAVGWSGYVVSFFHSVGVDLGTTLTQSPLIFDVDTQSFEFIQGTIINLPAVFICLATMTLLIFGVKESIRVNTVIVSVKVAVVLLFIFACAPKVDPANWHPFFPPNEGSFSRYGFTGMLTGATTVFFAYIGFDAVSTTAQEAKNPQRDLPIGIIGSLVICTVLYIAVCMVLTGVLNYKYLDGASPLAKAVTSTGMLWLSVIIEIGAIAGLTSVMLVLLMGQPRIFYAMAEDGLFPKVATRVHPRFKTPWVTTLISGITCAIMAGLLPIGVLGEMTSVGTLLAFVIVNIGVIILRRTQPDAPRKFKVPGGPYLIPVFGALFSTLLIATATTASLIRLVVWMAIGFLLYFTYGWRHSKINRPELYGDVMPPQNMKSEGTRMEEVRSLGYGRV